MVLNSPGTIDCNYRGEIGVILFNSSRDKATIKAGTRVAQLVFNKLPDVDIMEVKETSNTDRGQGGFGSSGLVNNVNTEKVNNFGFEQVFLWKNFDALDSDIISKTINRLPFNSEITAYKNKSFKITSPDFKYSYKELILTEEITLKDIHKIAESRFKDIIKRNEIKNNNVQVYPKSQDSFKDPNCTLTNEELIEKCYKWVSDLCKTGGKAWSLRVPPNFNNDPDILFCELIGRFRDTLKD